MYVSLEKIHLLIQEISYISDFDLENRVKVTETKSTFYIVLKVYVCWIGGNQAKGSKDTRYINYSDIFTYLCPPVTLKTRSRSLKSNQLLSLS